MISPPPLTEIRRIRKRLGITQQDLAKKSGTSQSLIARIESESADPRYSNVERIFAALATFQGKGTTAAQLMTRDVIGVEKNETLKGAATLFEEKGVSQIPVYDTGRIVGSLSEKSIQDRITNGDDYEKLATMKVYEVMDEPFPTVAADTQLSVVSALLEYNPAVTVTERGEIKGIITKSDILKVLRS